MLWAEKRDVGRTTAIGDDTAVFGEDVEPDTLGIVGISKAIQAQKESDNAQKDE